MKTIFLPEPSHVYETDNNMQIQQIYMKRNSQTLCIVLNKMENKLLYMLLSDSGHIFSFNIYAFLLIYICIAFLYIFTENAAFLKDCSICFLMVKRNIKITEFEVPENWKAIDFLSTKFWGFKKIELLDFKVPKNCKYYRFLK